MRTNNRTWRLGMLMAALALTAALSGGERTKISNINKNPHKYAGTEVTITGTVTSTVASPNPGTFQVDDGSGRLWVLSTSDDVPAQGSSVAVTGLVESGVNLGSGALVTTLEAIKHDAGSATLLHGRSPFHRALSAFRRSV
jgi:hypothetical protein